MAESLPVAAIVPTVELPPEMPLTLQVTPVAGLPEAVTLAVKSCADCTGTVAVGGETEMEMSSLRLMMAEALAWESAMLTAVMVTEELEGSVAGAE